MKKLFLVSVLTALFTLNLLAQQQQQQTIPKAATVKVSDISEDWYPVLRNLEMPVPGNTSYRNYLLMKKEEISKKYPGAMKSTKAGRANSSAAAPAIHRNFEGNIFAEGVPNDNDMAISDNGMLVSVINSTVMMFDVEADTLVQLVSLDAFAAPLGLPYGKYDPKVMYDPKQDRFILVFLEGNLSSTSYIIVAFSETNHPGGNWNLYALPGNPHSNDLWTDYPIIAMTDDEFFVTVNLLQENVSWQLGFVESIIWQVGKADGYAGNNLQTRVINNISHGGKPLRNLCPVRGGITTAGPDLYLLSNRNFDVTNDTVFLVRITGTLAQPSANVEIKAIKTDVPYGLSPNGKQPGTNKTLQTNDSRILGAFIELGRIQYVQNSINEATGRAAVYHGTITDLSAAAPQVSGSIITVDTLDFGYPNIASTGKYPGDNESMITFLYSGENNFPGMAGVFYDGYGNYSAPLSIKEGDNFTNVISGPQRWGDYSGLQRKYNEPGKVWAAGSFGTRIKPGPFWVNTSGTWLAELESPDTSSSPPVAVQPRPATSVSIKTYPNPAAHVVAVEFDLEEASVIEISVFDVQGRQVKTLYHDIARKGKNKFSFSTQPLSSGNYFLVIQTGNNELLRQKVVVAR